MSEKILLAYSGGLDTSIIIPWLLENFDCEVLAMAGEVGIGIDRDYLIQKALNCGASACFVEDIAEEFITDFIYPTLKAGAMYEGKYLLGTSFARPVIAKRMVEVARREGCTAIAHGCTGKGNDQVRFELTVKALAPELKIIAPWRFGISNPAKKKLILRRLGIFRFRLLRQIIIPWMRIFGIFHMRVWILRIRPMSRSMRKSSS